MTVAAIVLGAILMMSGALPTQDAPPAGEQSAPEQASPSEPTAPSEPSETFDLARLKIDQCPGERFDFAADEQTKVGLCSTAGASKDEIATMLESAIAQLESTDRMLPEARDQIVAQIRQKLAEVRTR